MKRYVFLIVFLSCLPFAVIFFNTLHPHTQDGLVHLARMAAYDRAFRDGEFPIRWAGYLNYGYGMPLFDFIYQLPYAISTLFISLGLGLVLSYKLVLFVSFLLSGLFAFLFGNELFSNKKRAFIFTIFYQFAQFRLVELFVRGDIGEVYTYTFLPLVCLGLLKLNKKVSFVTILLASVATALLVLSHNSLSLSFFVVSCLFVGILPFSKKSYFASFFSLILGLLLSFFYWFPALFDHKYTFGDLFMKNLYLQHFVPIQNFFIPNIFNNPRQRIGGVPIQIDLFHWAVFLIALWVFFKSKTDSQTRKIFLFSFILLAISFFFMQPVSKIVWQHSAFLRQFQFPWRFLGVIVFATSLLAVSLVDVFKQKIIVFCVACFVVVATIWYWVPSYGWDKINENYYWNYPLTSTYYGETDVIWTPGQATSFPKSPVAFAEGSGVVSNFIKNSSKQSFIITASTPATIVDHTEYFPGWKVFVNNKQTPIEFQDMHYRGQITFHVSQGRSAIQVIFGETSVRFFADVISLISFLALLGVGIFKSVAYAKK